MITERKDLANLNDPVGHLGFSIDELELFHQFWRKDKLIDRSNKSQTSNEWRSMVLGESHVQQNLMGETREWIEGVLNGIDEAERVTLQVSFCCTSSSSSCVLTCTDVARELDASNSHSISNRCALDQDNRPFSSYSQDCRLSTFTRSYEAVFARSDRSCGRYDSFAHNLNFGRSSLAPTSTARRDRSSAIHTISISCSPPSPTPNHVSTSTSTNQRRHSRLADGRATTYRISTTERLGCSAHTATTG